MRHILSYSFDPSFSSLLYPQLSLLRIIQWSRARPVETQKAFRPWKTMTIQRLYLAHTRPTSLDRLSTVLSRTWHPSQLKMSSSITTQMLFPGTQGTHSPAPSSYQGQDAQLLESQEKSMPKSDRRLCGMRQKVALWVIALVVAIIIIAAALGGALGATIGNKNCNNSNSNSSNGNGNSNDTSAGTLTNNIGNTAQDKTGLALLHIPTLDDLYMYYMSEDNQIVEAKYSNSNWQKHNRDLPASTTNITNDAADGSPIAAIHYTLQGNTIYRQICFIGSNGLIATCNTTGSTAWSSPYNPVIDPNHHPP
ncbi:hypothetical protein AC579_2401 [Pseudocercospora musae]|uniref:Fucose-specific lectin n=1 Tax=Pseudocercospora musae TaxID=113226 RepID=A0A139HKI0_9PEZI|nr:hypothetical protein AC579_2401 [Pseudocercospora musae]